MKNLKIAHKLIVAFGVLFILTAFISAYGATSIMRVNNDYAYVMEFPFQGYSLANRIQTGFVDTQQIMNRAAAYILAQGNAYLEINMQEQLFRERWAGINAYIELYRENLNTDPLMTVEEVDEMLGFITAMQTGFYRFFSSYVLPLMDAARAGNAEEALHLILQAGDTVNEASAHLSSLLAAEEDIMYSIGAELDAQAVRTFWTLIIISAVALAFAVAFLLYVSSTISKPVELFEEWMRETAIQGNAEWTDEELGILSKYTNRNDEVGRLFRSYAQMIEFVGRVRDDLIEIADGNLAAKVTVRSDKDRLSHALQKVVVSLGAMMQGIKDASELVSIGSGEISKNSNTLAEGAIEQAATLEQLLASVRIITKESKNTARMAEQAAELATDIRGIAESGSTHMDKMMSAVEKITESSLSIGKVIKVIDDIAFQTNILALNASVEAARAGQHGKGFAVVADEVRTLAARSAEAARETGELISDSMEKSQYGARIANDTAESLTEIVEGITKSSEIISEIANASEMQTAGIMQVNTGIELVAEGVSQTSITAEESATSAQELSGQSDMLVGMISRFKLKGTRIIGELSPVAHR
jgi:methyl-accepting chemotaxis protein